MVEVEHLSWDSNFFNLKIGRVDCCVDDLPWIDANQEKFKSQGYNLLYVFTPHSCNKTWDIVPIDVKRVYCGSTASIKDEESSVVEFVGKPEELYDLAYQSGFGSRYKLDKRFAESDFKRLYRTWIDNSVNHSIADVVFVVREGRKLLGFVTVSIKENIGYIGLLATDVQHRGKGIGTLLMNRCRDYLCRNNISKLKVATQATNIKACRFYEKCGLVVLSETDVFHLWLK